jgi:hypothetical protein
MSNSKHSSTAKVAFLENMKPYYSNPKQQIQKSDEKQPSIKQQISSIKAQRNGRIEARMNMNHNKNSR